MHTHADWQASRQAKDVEKKPIKMRGYLYLGRGKRIKRRKRSPHDTPKLPKPIRRGGQAVIVKKKKERTC